ncbi:hypothetical protein H0H92_004307, partial [Tricholoma furcatifolium]
THTKVTKARRVGGVVFAMQAIVGTIPPHAGRILYMARVDPHLILGCEVALDTVESNICSLESVQVAYCRRLLGLGPRLALAPLHTETGILPIRYRRTILALKYLEYVLELPATHYAALALRDSVDLAAHDKQSWAGDLVKVLSTLQCAGVPTPVAARLDALLDAERVAELASLVLLRCEDGLQGVLDNSSRLYLLRSRPPSPQKALAL